MNDNVQISNKPLFTQKCRFVSTVVFIPCTISNKITLEKLQIHVDSLRLTPEQNKPYVVVLTLILLKIKKKSVELANILSGNSPSLPNWDKNRRRKQSTENLFRSVL